MTSWQLSAGFVGPGSKSDDLSAMEAGQLGPVRKGMGQASSLDEADWRRLRETERRVQEVGAGGERDGPPPPPLSLSTQDVRRTTGGSVRRKRSERVNFGTLKTASEDGKRNMAAPRREVKKSETVATSQGSNPKVKEAPKVEGTNEVTAGRRRKPGDVQEEKAKTVKEENGTKDTATNSKTKTVAKEPDPAVAGPSGEATKTKNPEVKPVKPGEPKAGPSDKDVVKASNGKAEVKPGAPAEGKTANKEGTAAAASAWLLGSKTPQEISERLLTLCRRGDWLAVDTLLRQAEKTDLVHTVADEETGMTPLMYCVKENRVVLAERLLELGANINSKTKDNLTCLHFSASHAREDMMKLCLNKKADPNVAGGPKEQLPLHILCSRATGLVVHPILMLLRVSNKEARVKEDKDGWIPLALAIDVGNHGACRELLQNQAKDQINHRHKTTGRTAVHQAVLKKDFDLLRFLMDSDADVDIQDNEGQSALHLAAEAGDEVLVKMFFNAHANPHLQDKQDRTALHLAAEKGHTAIVEFLTEKFKASVFERTKDGNTLMHVAAAAGHPATALVFIRKGVPLHMPNKAGAKCIHMAAKRGHVEVVRTLIQKGEQVDSMDNDNSTALHIAVAAAQADVVEMLLGYGAQVQLKAGQLQETPLHIAARTKFGERCAEMLIKSGADVNATQEEGEAPLHYSCKEGNLKTVKLLLEDGSTLDMKDKVGETPLHEAVKSCQYSVVRALVEYGKTKYPDIAPIINAQNQSGETPLHCCCDLVPKEMNREAGSIMKLLLTVGGDVNCEIKQTRETPVHYCCRSGNTEVLKEILDSRTPADLQRSVNKQAKNGWSPLLFASDSGHPDVVTMLLNNHGRVDVFDESGKAALHLAAERGHSRVVDILLTNKAYVNVRSKKGLTPLHVAARNGYTDIVHQLVVDYSASFDSLTLVKQTPLHLAAEQGQLPVCSTLLDLGADANAVDNCGQTPLLLAAENDHSEVVKLFLRHKPELVSLANTKGFTCAHIAAMKGSVAVVKELMKSNRQVVTSARNKANSTPLHLAAEGGHSQVVKVLLEAGADPAEENEHGQTALHLAAQQGRVGVLEVLRKDISLEVYSNKTGFTPLHVAARAGQSDFVREMLGLQVSATVGSQMPVQGTAEDFGLSPLHLAAESGQENVVRLLLNSGGVQPDTTTNQQGTIPLHLAAGGGHIAVAGLLLSRSTDQVHSPDFQGRTALHRAAAGGYREMVGMLLGQGADINGADNNGMTALHYTVEKGYMDVVHLLIDSGATPLAKTADGKIPLCLAAAENHFEVLSYLLRKEHDTVSLLDDKNFLLDLTLAGIGSNNKAIGEFVLVSPAPIETAVKLSYQYRNLAIRHKDRAKDLETMASYCQSMASELLSIAAADNNTGELLKSLDSRGYPFLDVLIELDQKEVVAHPAVQRYLTEIWMGNLKWSTWKIVALFIAFVCFPLTWVLCSLPLGHKLSGVPIIKFTSYLVSHIFFTILLSFTLLNPWTPLYKSTHLFPHWHEWLLMLFLIGNCVADITSPKDRGGLGWVRLATIIVSSFGVIVHAFAFLSSDDKVRLILLYIRNQFFAMALLLSFLEFLNFLTFHHLFGPWAVIIRDLMKDLLRFLAILAIFLLGFSLHLCSTCQPVFEPPDTDSSITPLGQELHSPIATFEMLFFALFGLVEPDYMPPMHLSPGFAKTIVKVVFGVYMMVTVVVLINLLIAMMSNTYQRIQAHSDTEWKYGRAKLIRNMNMTLSAPSPLNILICGPAFFKSCRKARKAKENGGTRNRKTAFLAVPPAAAHSTRRRWYHRFRKRQQVVPAGLDRVEGAQLSQSNVGDVVDWHNITIKYLELRGNKMQCGFPEELRKQSATPSKSLTTVSIN